MIALFGAGRGGGARAVRFTVPWCPTIAGHPCPELPGTAVRVIQTIGRCCLEDGIHPSELGRVGSDVLAEQFADTPEAIVVLRGSIAMLLELEWFSGVGPKTGVGQR